jgi:hypothetical protein
VKVGKKECDLLAYNGECGGHGNAYGSSVSVMVLYVLWCYCIYG